jgi:hypothetical protein
MEKYKMKLLAMERNGLAWPSQNEMTGLERTGMHMKQTIKHGKRENKENKKMKKTTMCAKRKIC